MMALDRRDGLFFVVIFFGLLVRLALAPPIWHHGEAREGLVVQGIVHNHEWILPLRNGEMPSKPPFFHWLAALPAFVFGPSDWIVRLPSAIGAATMAAATFFMGSQMGAEDRLACRRRSFGNARILDFRESGACRHGLRRLHCAGPRRILFLVPSRSSRHARDLLCRFGLRSAC